MRLSLGVCDVRSWRRGDAAALVQHANNRKIWLNVRDRFPHPYTARDARAFLASVVGARPETSFAVEVDGAAIGGIAFRIQTDVERIGAELGYWLGHAQWGRGLMTRAVALYTPWVMRELSLYRLQAFVFDLNPASASVLLRNGFEEEGLARCAVVKSGEPYDVRVFAKARRSLSDAP